MADKDKVIGKALYMEFRNSSYTYQTFITPDGLTNDGRPVPATLYRRQISKLSPRKAWKTYALPNLMRDEFGNYHKHDIEEAHTLTKTRIQYLENIFNQLSARSYRLYKQPIVIEVSAADLEDIRSSKTPYKILGRVTRLRRHLGFGEQLFAE
jgi:hypothetical protein